MEILNAVYTCYMFGFFNLGLKLLKKYCTFNITCSVLLHADHIILEEIQPSVAYLNTACKLA